MVKEGFVDVDNLPLNARLSLEVGDAGTVRARSNFDRMENKMNRIEALDTSPAKCKAPTDLNLWILQTFAGVN